MKNENELDKEVIEEEQENDEENKTVDEAYQLKLELDILQLARGAWDDYIKENIVSKINKTNENNEELQNLNIKKDILLTTNDIQLILNSIGIVKTDNDIKNAFLILSQENQEEYLSNEYYSKKNYLELVEMFKFNRIDEKILVNIFQLIDNSAEPDIKGVITYNKLKTTSLEYNLDLSDKEILEMLNFFETSVNLSENQKLSYSQFFEMYYQG